MDNPCQECNRAFFAQRIKPNFVSKRKSQTNADRIRAMTDEELAEFLCSTSSPKGTVNCDTCRANEFCHTGHNGWIDWLRQEAYQRQPILCPYCGGSLSEIREHDGKLFRHCFACHMEFYEEGEQK